MIGSEAVPFAKTGGLADVLGALPPALARLGWDVTVALPRYRGVDGRHARRTRSGQRRRLHARGRAVRRAAGRRRARAARRVRRTCTIARRCTRSGGERLSRQRAPLRGARARRARVRRAARAAPSVVHAHDWQAGLAPVYLQHALRDASGARRHADRLHDSQPRVSGRVRAGLAAAPRSRRGELGLDRLEFWGRISFLKGGINARDVITTVSRRYAEEIQTPEFGSASTASCASGATDLVGILNGIDTSEWDPAHDRVPAGAVQRRAISTASAPPKRALLARYGLPADEAAVARPLVGMISRMVDQKGFDLIAGRRRRAAALDATFVVLGTGEARYQDMWRGSPRAIPIAHRRRHRVRRSARASDRRRRRHLPDAVAVRALRPESDVQPPVRHRARSSGPSAAWPTRSTDYAPGRPASPRASSSRTTRGAALLARAAAGAGRFSRQPGAGGLSRRPACGRIIPGTIRPGSTSKYMSWRWARG